MKRIVAGVLEVAYLETGPADGTPVILLHGFPYDVHAHDEVAERLAAAGRRCIVPYLRGYGPTRFLSADTRRSGQQASLGADLLALMEALEIPSATLAGYDWGGRAACIVAALWPERVRGLVTSGSGYNIQNIAEAGKPLAPEQEHRFWYQYYFHSERGRAGLAANRREFCRLLWKLWSPSWDFDGTTFERSAAAFDNPDFVDVVIHSYRHRFGGIPGDPAVQGIEDRLAHLPDIAVPSIVLQGADDGVDPPEEADTDAAHFTGPYECRTFPRTGHNLPQELPGNMRKPCSPLPDSCDNPLAQTNIVSPGSVPAKAYSLAARISFPSVHLHALVDTSAYCFISSSGGDPSARRSRYHGRRHRR